MTGIKLARIRCCAACPERTIVPGAKWPTCQGVPMSNEFMESGECPLGNWDSLEAAEMQEEPVAMPRQRKDYTGCRGCKEKMLRKMKAQMAREEAQ